MQIRRGREADTERLVALAGQIFETEQEIPRALTPLPPENRPQWWCVEEDGALLGGVALYWEDDAWHMGRFVISPELRGCHVGTALLETALTDIFAQDIRDHHGGPGYHGAYPEKIRRGDHRRALFLLSGHGNAHAPDP